MNDGKFDFNQLFVLDLANNHQGSLEHGLNIISSMSEVIKKQNVRGAIKFQFRQLDTFIHPSHKENSNNKHIPRFISTRLLKEDYKKLLGLVKKNKLISICTPFDEESVDVIDELSFDVIKVASCSARDWPLLTRIALSGKPVIISTGGLELKDVDNIVSFFVHKGVDFAIMHCVSIYPTPDENMNLYNITMLKNRYPDLVVGWSTHEDPDDTVPIQLSQALGAGMFERHVGIQTDDIKLNAYSSTPEQIDNWITAYKEAKTKCGQFERVSPTPVEVDSIDSLKRGVYARKDVKAGTILTLDDIYFAMPYEDGQLDSNLWIDNIKTKEMVVADGAINLDNVFYPKERKSHVLKTAIHDVKALLNEAKVFLDTEFEVEYSHHYGVEKFRETGVVIVNCINREYCKKILVQLPGQKHPSHYHKRKEETFQVLFGELHSEIDGHRKTLLPGNTALVLPGAWHHFWTDTGVVFEEISTTHFNDDSVYSDPEINNKKREERKTIVDHWGRYQLEDKID